ncbi:MAG: CDP-alcohol phosphatidyltransferase family protein [Rhodospirillales bacterium]|nr:CDP-alcohol phosphatidyltransferase family protein [Rhodospirillales bacterium]MBO6788816.1 CDP-alcohol phosphatidyltransferase family protein [Rhodospirillales bacterium]
MGMKNPPYDQRIAAWMVRPLVRTPVTPNHVSMVTLFIALTGAALLATGEPASATWGAGLFVLARFLDHFDGELARQSGKTSRLGYYLDYIVGSISYAALFFCMGWGFKDSGLGIWAVVLGSGGAAAAIISMFTNLGIDKQTGGDETGDAVGYPGFAGFELEDGIYLLWPVTWLGFLYPFFIAAGIGATIYCLYTCVTLLRMRART